VAELSAEEVRHVARLARLALTEEEIDSLGGDLAKILDWVEKIGKVAAEEVPRTGHVYPLVNVFRRDEPRPSMPRKDALSGAPAPEDGRFAVPRIVEEAQ
jgi:aspartyl-tRNA(Asn)/glutamyl-tRNA(Gln) amidotransferase subunit C